MAFVIGQKVRTEILDQRTGMVGYEYVIGTPRGMPDVVVVATTETIGCPINIKWCQPVDGINTEMGLALRCRYIERYPNYLDSALYPRDCEVEK